MKTTTAFVLATVLGLGSLNAFADAAKTIDAVYKEKTKLEGKQVTVKGKVVKVNNGIMGRNFLHIQDGTGGKDSNDLSITSAQTAKVGDQVTVRVREIDNRGRINLTLRGVPQQDQPAG